MTSERPSGTCLSEPSATPRLIAHLHSCGREARPSTMHCRVRFGKGTRPRVAVADVFLSIARALCASPRGLHHRLAKRRLLPHLPQLTARCFQIPWSQGAHPSDRQLLRVHQHFVWRSHLSGDAARTTRADGAPRSRLVRTSPPSDEVPPPTPARCQTRDPRCSLCTPAAMSGASSASVAPV